MYNVERTLDARYKVKIWHDKPHRRSVTLCQKKQDQYEMKA